MEAGLRHAIVNHELELHYQPQVDANNLHIGAEALLRWHHPDLGNVAPGDFIPVAEETGLIHEIGYWIFDQACADLAQWMQSEHAFDGHISVNVCAWQFARPDFIDELRKIIARHTINPSQLMLELTETAVLYDLDESIEKLRTLRSMGLKVALDDFGTGYSSLAYLRQLPLDQLKIDISFVAELNETTEHPLVESMIAIGRHMNLTVLAEGVETRPQYAKLLALGCKLFQGFLFCRPLPKAEFEYWLSHQQKSSSTLKH